MAILYVATDGNNSTGDGSKSTPWLTIAKAITEASSGDNIRIAPGTYTEDIRPGSAGLQDKANLLIERDPDESGTVIHAATGAGWYSFYLDVATGWNGLTFKNMTFRPATGAGVLSGLFYIKVAAAEQADSISFDTCIFDNANGRTVQRGLVAIRNNGVDSTVGATFTTCTFSNHTGIGMVSGDNFNAATALSGTLGNFTFTGCTFDAFASATAYNGVLYFDSITSLTVTGCTATNITGTSGYFIKLKGNCTTLSVTNNDCTIQRMFFDAGTSISAGAVYSDGTTWSISNNTVVGGSFVYYTNGPAAGGGGADITIEGNTFTRDTAYTEGYYGIALGDDSWDDSYPLGQVIVRRNTMLFKNITGTGDAHHMRIGGGTAGAIIEYNDTASEADADVDWGLVLKNVNAVVRYNKFKTLAADSSAALYLISCTGAEVYNNVFVGRTGLKYNKDDAVGGGGDREPTGNSVYNNIFITTVQAIHDGDSAGYGFDVDYNLYYVVSGTYGSINGSDAASLAELRALWVSEHTLTNDANSVYGDPQFVSYTPYATGDDLHTKNNSPARLAGTPELCVDIGRYTSTGDIRAGRCPRMRYV